MGDQRELRDLIRAPASEQDRSPGCRDRLTGEFPWDVVELFRESSILALPFAERYGGTGTGALMTLVAIEELSKVCATSGLILAVQSLGGRALELAGSDDQKERYLPRLASGEWLAAYALTEPGSGSDSVAMTTSAERSGSDYVLTGGKRFITNAGVVSLYAVFAKTDPDADTPESRASSSSRPIWASRPGRIEPKLGIKGSTTGEVFFNDCRVPAECSDRGGGRGLPHRDARPGPFPARRRRAGSRDRARRDRLRARLLTHPRDDGETSSASTSSSPRCSPTWRRPAPPARGLLYRVGEMIDAGVDGPELTKASAMAKLFCSDAAMEVTTNAVQVLGGLRLHEGVPGGAHAGDAKITQIYEGTNQIQRLVIAREMFCEQRAFLLASG